MRHYGLPVVGKYILRRIIKHHSRCSYSIIYRSCKRRFSKVNTTTTSPPMSEATATSLTEPMPRPTTPSTSFLSTVLSRTCSAICNYLLIVTLLYGVLFFLVMALDVRMHPSWTTLFAVYGILYFTVSPYGLYLVFHPEDLLDLQQALTVCFHKPRRNSLQARILVARALASGTIGASRETSLHNSQSAVPPSVRATPSQQTRHHPSPLPVSRSHLPRHRRSLPMDPKIPRAIAAGALAFLASLYTAAPSIAQAAYARLLTSITNTPAEYWLLHPTGQSVTFCAVLAIVSFAMALRTGFADDVRDMWAPVFGRRAEAMVPEDEDENNGGGVNDRTPYRMRKGHMSEEPIRPHSPDRSLFSIRAGTASPLRRRRGRSFALAGRRHRDFRHLVSTVTDA
jgi:hypothetical protein